MREGWVKLHRSVLNLPVFDEPELLRLWLYLLLKASHQPRDVPVGQTIVHLQPGQLITGRKRIAQDLRISETNVRCQLKRLVVHQLVNLKTTNRFSLVTLMDWDFFQSSDQQSDQQNASQMPTKCQQPDHKQECNKKEKKEKNAKKGVPRACFAPPTLAEVQSYVAERHSPVIPQEFIDFYAAKGWMVGKTPMKDWKAACRNAETWDRWHRKTVTPPFYDYSNTEDSL